MAGPVVLNPETHPRPLTGSCSLRRRMSLRVMRGCSQGDLLVERRLLRVLRIFGSGQVGVEGQHAVRVEALVYALQAVKAAY